jgi:hypothetical protein
MNDLASAVARAVADAGEKISKRTAKYGDGMPERHCGICQYFEGAHCRIVAGNINADDWCRYFDLEVGEASGAE